MAAEENEHRRRLIDLFVSKFGEHIPLIRRQDIRGYIPQKPVWQARPLHIETVRAHAHEMELAAARFYRQAMARTSDASIRKLLGDLAEVEDKHDRRAARPGRGAADRPAPATRKRRASAGASSCRSSSPASSD